MSYPTFEKDLSDTIKEQISSSFVAAVMLVCFNEIKGNIALALITRYILENPNGDVFREMEKRFELVSTERQREISTEEFDLILYKVQNLLHFSLQAHNLRGYEMDVDVFIRNIERFVSQRL